MAAARARRARARVTAPYSRARHLARILEDRSVKPDFQPIHDLSGREVVAYEALARGPRGTPLERPDVLFATARELNLVQELDWVCRAAAMEHAMGARFPSSLTLFINVEPDVAATRAPDDLALVLKRAQRNLRVVLEVTERALLERPAELLNWLTYARKRWWGVALDDVGVNPDSLALLPFVRPDVVKLNHHFVRDTHDDADRQVIKAIRAYTEDTGAAIVAEGIETGAHLVRAREELGATLGQGWYLGRPAVLPAHPPSPRAVVPFLEHLDQASSPSPWGRVSAVAEVHSLPVPAVRRRFTQVQLTAQFAAGAPVVLVHLPAGPGPWGTLSETLPPLRDFACFVGALGPEMDVEQGLGWHTSSTSRGEEIANEWVLVVVGPDVAAAVVAYSAGETDDKGQPLMEVCWTQDRATVVRVADDLMRRQASPPVDLNGRLRI